MPILRFLSRVRVIAGQALAILALVPVALLPPHAMALPEGGQVAAGHVTFDSSENALDLTQVGNTAIVNWESFSIGLGEQVTIHQSGADAAMLSRVLGANPSELLGQLKADGQVFLINPNGVLVGADARVDVGAFVASSLDVVDADFLNGGELGLQGDSLAGIVNLGLINATNGDVILVAYSVRNEGEIRAEDGTVGLAAGNEVVLSPDDDQRILVKAALPSDTTAVGIDNGGVITAAQAELAAAGGDIYELAINQHGIIRATGVTHRNGRVMLTAEQGRIEHSGTIAAVDADGSGGEVLVGGDYQGANPDVANAAQTTVTASGIIDVSAAAPSADGGKAVIWADGHTVFEGRINGRAGESGGDGGFAEVSGKRTLDYRGVADLRAPVGATGNLLLDPDAITIQQSGADTNLTQSGTDPVLNSQTADADSILLVSTLETQLATAGVTLDASNVGTANGTITVNDAVSWTSGNTLTFRAGDNINVNADLTGTSAKIDFGLGRVDEDSIPATTGRLTVNAAATVTADNVTLRLNDALPASGSNALPESWGGADFNGKLIANTLDIQSEKPGDPGALGGINGDVIIDNAANEIGTLSSSVNSGNITGKITVVDGAGALTVDAKFNNVEGDITVRTPGNLTLAAGAKVSAGFGHNVVLAAETGSFINQAGASAVDADGRFLIYSDDPANTTLDGLAGNPVYDRTYADNAPGTITQTGDRFLYGLTPTLTLTADDVSRTYGAANPAFTFTGTGLIGGDVIGDAITGTPSFSTTATADSDVGSYALSISAGSLVNEFNYALTFAAGTVTVQPAALTITADNLAKSEGGANPTFTATFTGLVNGDTAADISGLTLTSTATTNSTPGDYAIVAANATNTNYTITHVNGILTINGVPTLVITADDFSKLYGAALPGFTSTITGFNTGDDASVISGLTYTTTATAGSDVGTYTITPTGATATGYQINFVSGSLTINPAALAISVNDAVRHYGSANPAFATSLTGLVNGDDASVVSELTFATSATDTSAVGDYTITAIGGAATNYTLTKNPGTLTVDQRPVSITANDHSLQYGDTVTNADLSAKVDGLASFDNESVLGTIDLRSDGFLNLADVGDYALVPSLLGTTSGNYQVTFVNGSASVTPRQTTVTVNDISRLFGDANPLFTAAVTNSLSLAPLDVSGLVFATDAVAASNVGSYTVTASGASDPNYAITFAPGALTVTPAPLTLTAVSQTREYGDANAEFSHTLSGLKLDHVIGDVLANIAFNTTASTGTGVGSYALGVTGDTLSTNYDVTFTDGTITVNQAPLVVAPTYASRLYGAANPEPTVTATGLKNGDTTDVVKGALFLNTTPVEAGVGSYTVQTLSAAALNYRVTLANGVMDVKPLPLTITAASFTREYGDPNPDFTATFAGLASFDTADDITGLEFLTPATDRSQPFDFSIFPRNATNANYDISFVPGTLTITPAPLNIDVPSVSRLYGRADPGLSVGPMIGLKFEDDRDVLGLQLSTAATATSDVGEYPISASLIHPGYTPVFGDATYSILPAPLTVTIDNHARVYGEMDSAPIAVSAAGLVFRQTVDDVLRVSDPTDQRTAAGTHLFEIEPLSPNYDLTLTAGTGRIQVFPRNIALKPTNVVRYYGDEATPDILVAGDGLASFHTLADVANPIEFWSDFSIDRFANFGRRTTRVQIVDNPNYNILNVPGIYMIVPRPIELTVQSVDINESQPLPNFVTTVTNLPSFELVPNAFPDLSYRLFTTNAAPTTQVALALEDVEIPAVVSDAAFLARFPSQLDRLDPVDFAPDAGGIPIEFEQIELLPVEVAGVGGMPFGEIGSDGVVIVDGEVFPEDVLVGGLVISNAASDGEKRFDEPTVSYIQPTGFLSNSNYVVTKVTNGVLTMRPDPGVVEARRLEAERQERIEENRNVFWGLPPAGHEGVFIGGGFMDLPSSALQAVFDGVRNLALSGGSPELLAMIKKAGTDAYGSSEGGSISEADLVAFFRGARSNADAMTFVAPVLAGYVKSLAGRDAASYSADERQLVFKFNNKMTEARTELVAGMKSKHDAWIAAEKAKGPRLSAVFDGTVPYGEFMGEAAGELIGAKIAATAGAGAVAGGAAGAGVFAAAGAILPYSAAAGGAAVGAAGAGGVVAAAGPAAIVAGAVVVGVVRGIQVAENMEQQSTYDSYANAPIVGVNLESMDLNGSGTEATMNQALFLIAFADFMGG